MITRLSFIAVTSPLFLVTMLLLPSSMASAEMTGACLGDAKSLCAGIQPGGGKIRDCLKSHVKELSDGCQAVVLKVVNAKACAGDVKQFCADTKPGEGRVEACMKAHVADVSDACKVAMANEAAGDD
jgi:hypothetical protein